MFLVVNWICAACVLDVIFVHILEKHFEDRKELAYQSISKHIEEYQSGSKIKTMHLPPVIVPPLVPPHLTIAHQRIA